MTSVTAVSIDQMREVDRLMTEEVGISLLQMMENAGRCLATHARAMLDGDVRGRRILVLAGRGGNGGGGLAAARRLSIWGADVAVALAQPPSDMRGAPRQQLAIVEWMGIPAYGRGDRPGLDMDADLVIDALIGYGLRGAAAEPVADHQRTGVGDPITCEPARPELAYPCLPDIRTRNPAAGLPRGDWRVRGWMARSAAASADGALSLGPAMRLNVTVRVGHNSGGLRKASA